MEARHTNELQALDERIAAEQGDRPVDAVAAALAANSLYGRAPEEDSKQVRTLHRCHGRMTTGCWPYRASTRAAIAFSILISGRICYFCSPKCNR